MNFVLRLPDGEELDLGPTFELLKAIRELGRIDLANRYAQLHLIPYTREEPVPAEYARAVAAQARSFLDEHRATLSEHAQWLLERLAKIEA